MACGMRSKDLVQRWGNRKLLHVQISRVVKGVALEDLESSRMELAPEPSMIFDPNQSNKRTVRKGSDPIHNRS